MGVGVKIEGFAELQKTLDRYSTSVQRQIGRKMLTPAAAHLSKAMKAAVQLPDDYVDNGDTGRGRQQSTRQHKAIQALVKKGVKRKKKTYTNSGIVVEFVGIGYFVQSKSKNIPFGPNLAAIWAERMELGRAGRSDARSYTRLPFIKATANREQTAIMRIMQTRLKALIKEEAQKAASKVRAR